MFAEMLCISIETGRINYRSRRPWIIFHEYFHRWWNLGLEQSRFNFYQEGSSVFQQDKIDFLPGLVPPEFQLHIRREARDQLQGRKRFVNDPDVLSFIRHAKIPQKGISNSQIIEIGFP